jgi:hypothetical protein
MPSEIATTANSALLATRIRGQPDRCRQGDAWASSEWKALETQLAELEERVK